MQIPARMFSAVLLAAAVTGCMANATNPRADGELVIGNLLPQTGDLAFLGPSVFGASHLAVEDINKAGGVLGKPVRYVDADSGDSKTDIASQAIDKLMSEKMDVLVGAAASSVSSTIIDKVTGAGVVQISPSNTAASFTDYPDKGLYFRTAPSDVLQGRVLGDLIANDKRTNVALVHVDDPYGKGLAESVAATLTKNGSKVALDMTYDGGSATFAAEVAKIRAANPDSVVLIGFEETKKIFQEFQAQQLTPDKMPLYFSDGNLANYQKDFPPGTLLGVKGTMPGAQTSTDFQTRLKATSSKIEDFSYAGETYDAVTLVALAAEAAKSDDSRRIADTIVSVSKDGEKCTSFEACKKLLDAGKDIDYEGLSGPVTMSDKGDIIEASIGVYSYQADNNFTAVEFKKGKL